MDEDPKTTLRVVAVIATMITPTRISGAAEWRRAI
jgi:hypothetical protein